MRHVSIVHQLTADLKPLLVDANPLEGTRRWTSFFGGPFNGEVRSISNLAEAVRIDVARPSMSDPEALERVTYHRLHFTHPQAGDFTFFVNGPEGEGLAIEAIRASVGGE